MLVVGRAAKSTHLKGMVGVMRRVKRGEKRISGVYAGSVWSGAREG